MNISEGDKLYLRGKYGVYHDVTVKSIENKYVIVDGGFMFGTQKVRLDKLVKQPSKEFKETSNQVNKIIDKAQDQLWRLKEGK